MASASRAVPAIKPTGKLIIQPWAAAAAAAASLNGEAEAVDASSGGAEKNSRSGGGGGGGGGGGVGQGGARFPSSSSSSTNNKPTGTASVTTGTISQRDPVYPRSLAEEVVWRQRRFAWWGTTYLVDPLSAVHPPPSKIHPNPAQLKVQQILQQLRNKDGKRLNVLALDGYAPVFFVWPYLARE
ncbi:hypothetical protein DAPPUDRAFT_94605 [Daphnia pulex]|uniref:Uncharacterized protein n=1 Tax=Daphnia pulex TaxID=6669 RepID=E9FSI0_DAPPU|nr:hypothetical protein DAPPUDRAFT_94605 [Daphnia pulex]|eukprot:EFX89210.1 hypothetical protein DAPPUDRAFT_94605 [Daphnia pulex]